MTEALYTSHFPCGARLLVEPLARVRSCALGFWVQRGSTHEGPAEEGLAHFIEHMVFKGTEHFPTPEAMAEATDRLGGNLDAFTGKETACFYGKVLRDQLPDLVAILGDLVTSPRFDPEELVRERDVVLEEIAQSEDTPDDWVSELFYLGFWPEAPLAHPILGRPDQVAAFDTDRVQAFFRKTYRGPHLLISAAGDLEPEALEALLAPVLERLPAGPPEAEALVSPSRAFITNVPRRGLQQTSLVMGFPTGGHTHPARVATGLLSTVLGGGMSSRLFLELREKRALCYQVGSYLSPYRGTGALQITASCAPGKARELVARTLGECERLREQGATPDELERAKRQARTSLVFGQESSSSRMFTLAHQAIHLDRTYTLDEQLAEIDAVDLETLNAAAREVLAPERFSVAALGTRRGGEIRRSDL